jgi:NTP pyrophosphatase (non-canonical NTP hydrolase)
MGAARRPLTFAEVSAANLSRCLRWHPGFPNDEDWSLADWCLAMVGEAGEAANVVKKIHRQKYGLRGRLDPPMEALGAALAEELADVYLYLDLLAAKAGIDLPAAIVAKFNAVSERQDFPERLAARDHVEVHRPGLSAWDR